MVKRKFFRIALLTLVTMLFMACTAFFAACGSNGTSENSQESEISGEDEEKEIPVTSIALDKTSLTLKIGESETLTATVLPSDATDKTVTWMSAEPSVATVSGGTVTAVGCGTTTILVITENAQVATCSVTVPDPYIDFSFTLVDDGYELTSYTGTDGEVTIPAGYNGKAVTAIGRRAFYNCSGLYCVTIPASVTRIGEESFMGCESLTDVNITDLSSWCKILFASYNANPLYYAHGNLDLWLNGEPVIDLVIPDDVTSIGEYTFSHCGSLTSVTIGDSVTNIGDKAFTGCSNLTSVNITDLSSWCRILFASNSANPLYYAHNLCLNGELVTDLVFPDNVTGIEAYTFSDCENLTSVTFGDGAMNIGANAFFDCGNLTSVTFGDGATNIGEYAFSHCGSLTNVTFGKGATNIGANAFSDCSSLTSVTIPDSVTSIGDGAFSYCRGLTYVNITDLSSWCKISFGDYPLDSAYNLCLNGELVTDLVIPDNVTNVGEYAFSHCSSLTSVTIGDNVMSIGDSAFSDCSSLTSATIEDNVTSIGGWAFNGCSGLTNIVIADNVTSIGKYAFNDCINLTSIVIPDNVTSIADGAFKDCSGLTSVTIGDGVTSIGEDAFHGCSSLTSIVIPGNVTSIGKYAFKGCSSLTSATFEEPNGWSYSFGSISSLSYPSAAARNLTSTYSWYDWERR